MVAIWYSAWNMALTVASSDRRTRFGKMALCPASASPPKPAARAGSRNNGHSEAPRSALTARPALHPAIEMNAIRSRRRRSTTSASEPPSRGPTISGSNWASETSPTSSEERVIV
jgi:hypothetical protein